MNKINYWLTDNNKNPEINNKILNLHQSSSTPNIKYKLCKDNNHT